MGGKGASEGRVSAKERKASAQREKDAAAKKAAEDREWAEAQGPKTKAAKKKEEAASKAAEKAARKAEDRELEKRETDDMKTYGKKAGKNNRVPKVTAAELAKRFEEERRKKLQAAHQPKDEVSVNEYARQLDSITINNRKEGLVEATGIDQVVSAMDALSPVQEKSEKVNIKAAYAAFEETELPRLKADKPGLTHSQQKEHLWKAWQKSPLNPTLEKNR